MRWGNEDVARISMPEPLRSMFDPEALRARLAELQAEVPEEVLERYAVTRELSPVGRVFRSGVRAVFRVVPDRSFMMRALPASASILPVPGCHVRRVGLGTASLLLYRRRGRSDQRRQALETGERPPAPRTVFHVHGGGFVAGLTDHYRQVARQYLQIPETDLVATLDYRYYPHAVHPAALEDIEAAWRYLLMQGCDASTVILTGDSAGGNLILALMLKLRDQGERLPGGACIQSPWTDMTFSGDSVYLNLYLDPMFGVPPGAMPRWQAYRDLLGYAAQHDRRDPYLSPVFGDYRGLPPILIQTGSDEMLLSDSLRVLEACERAGVPARFSVYEGMFHAFPVIAGEFTPEGEIAKREAFAAIRGLWEGQLERRSSTRA